MSSAFETNNRRALFNQKYLEAIEASGTPDMRTIHNIIKAVRYGLLELTDAPEYASFAPLTRFVRKAFQRNIDTSWLKDEDLLKMNLVLKIQHFVQSLISNGKIIIQDAYGEEIRNPDPEFKEMIHGLLPGHISHEIASGHIGTGSIDEFLDLIGGACVQVDDEEDEFGIYLWMKEEGVMEDSDIPNINGEYN